MMRALSTPRRAIHPRPRKLPVVAIVGRPNVGKSTLFNRIIGERRAIVDDFPGVTRDRNYAEAVWDGRQYIVIDTGGLDTEGNGGLEASVQDQSRRAVEEADVVIFLFDGKSGLNPLDAEAVDLLRVSQKPVLFAVNKLDSERRADNLYEFYALGLDTLFSISAEHGLGIADLLDQMVARFPELPAFPNETAEEKNNRGYCAAVACCHRWSAERGQIDFGQPFAGLRALGHRCYARNHTGLVGHPFRARR